MTGLLLLALLALTLGLALRTDPLVYLAYVLAGTFLVNRFWLARSRRALSAERTINVASDQRPVGASDTSAFIGDRATVTLTIVNRGWLPVAWGVVRERLPTGLRSVEPAEWTLSFPPYGRHVYRYQLACLRRGFFPIGPLTVSTGTPWEADRTTTMLAPASMFTVYPLIVALERLGLPSRLPLGTRRRPDPLLPDPSRIIGVRDYQPGDRLRDVHWPASARTGALQVKQYQPSQPLQVALFLDFAAEAYDFRTRERASELAVVVAASLATHIIDQRQAVGLLSNGRDPLGQRGLNDPTAPLPEAVGPPRPPAERLAASADPANPELPELVTAPGPPGPPIALPETDRLVATSLLPPALPRRTLVTDPYAPHTLPEETYDEDGNAFIDGPAIGGAPAAPLKVPVRDGRGHLATLLTLLARIALREQPTESETNGLVALPFVRLVRRRAAGLPWGTTLILITSAPTEELLPTMVHLRNSGFSPLAIFVQAPHLTDGPEAAVLRQAGFPAFSIEDTGRLADLPLLTGRGLS